MTVWLRAVEQQRLFCPYIAKSWQADNLTADHAAFGEDITGITPIKSMLSEPSQTMSVTSSSSMLFPRKALG